MLKIDKEALICDLAETYQIYDYTQLPLVQVAVFSCGLREDSRIKRKLNGQSVSADTLLFARMVDSLNDLVWMKTKDAQKGKNRPAKIFNLLINKNPKQQDEITFNSGEEFHEMRRRIIQGGDDSWRQN
ncbi:DUF5361 domain-containing protein [Enterococcus dispar]